MAMHRLGLPVSRGLRILTYHEIVPHGTEITDPYNQIGADRFRRHLEILKGAGYEPRSVTESLEASDPTRVALTFDDGLVEHAAVVLPLLKRYECTATFYIVTEALRGNLAIAGRNLRFLTVPMLREIAGSGMEIGSHGRTHGFLAEMEPGEMEGEIAGSSRDLEVLVGRPPVSFAYPYGERGSFDGRCVRILEKAGYAHAVTTVIGSNPPGAPAYRLKRIPIYHDDPDDLVLAKASGRYDWVGGFQGFWLGMFPPSYR
jgi:peptidoglycan/xylan/chitin deacetylase (PgdA/CDA1 family)